MEIATLAVTAYTLLKPFIDKTGDGVAKKIGEDIWAVIKGSFSKSEEKTGEELVIIDENQFQLNLQTELRNNPQMATDLLTMVRNAEQTLSQNSQQNVNSYGKVEKQINIQNNTGDIQM